MARESGEQPLPRWYVIHTHAKQEWRAEHNLLSWNVETFVPKYESRRRQQFRSEPISTIRPLFSGYIFARFDAVSMYHKIRYTRGVHSIVSVCNRPVPLDDGIIELIKSRIGEGGYVKLEEDFKPGDEVLVKGGPFEGFVGVFGRRMKNTERVQILLKTAYQFHVEVSESDIVKLAV
jgi:transcriptional antiterminator RfaH